MSGIPREIPDLGSVTQLPRQNPGFNPAEQPSLTSEEYFVWTRVDGHTSLRDLILMLGLAPERAIGILRRLRRAGALLLPGESPGTGGAAAAGAALGAATVRQRPVAAALRSRHDPGTQPARAPAASAPASDAAGPAAPRQGASPVASPGLGGAAVGAAAATVRQRPVSYPERPGVAAATGAAAARAAAGDAPPRQSAVVVERSRPETPADAATQASGRARPETPAPAVALPRPTDLSAEERAAMAAPVDLAEPERLRIIAAVRAARAGDFFALFEVPPDADKRTLKRAYFRLSKEFHPDRHYGKNLGVFAEWTSLVFETASKAFERLANERQRHGGGPAGTQPPQNAQTKQEYALELFDQACALEASGELEQARKLFAAALRLDPRPRYLLRAARCAQRAGSVAEAIEYASKAVSLSPDNPSCARTLADAQRAAGDLAAAETTLLHALTLKTENDVLAGELQADLERVRRERAGGAAER